MGTSVSRRYDVVVVGAGAAGVGVGCALSGLDCEFRILEREGIGSSFRKWPEETRFLTPSFPGHGFDMPDLNAVSPRTSPALGLDCEHPSGEAYADYLAAVADDYELPVETDIEVTDIRRRTAEPAADGVVALDGGPSSAFRLETTDGPIDASFVVWAAGEFGTPRRTPFPGAEYGVHTADVDSFRRFADNADSMLVVGGSESGIDAAVAIAETDTPVTVLDRGAPWAYRHPDPSETLAPITRERLDAVADSVELVGDCTVESLSASGDGYALRASVDGEDRTFWTEAQPLLATGYRATLGPTADLFPIEAGSIDLTDRDESPTTPGLFLAGAPVEHDGQSFCFVYKYRTRFPVVAETIGERLGLDTEAMVERYREANMYVADPSCCGDSCGC